MEGLFGLAHQPVLPNRTLVDRNARRLQFDLIVPNTVVQIGFDRVHLAISDIDAAVGVMKTKF